ncbi:MAG TPA: MBL fold metallo-hydrolase [bacterium (Candidatus Stahlbacteria)]|nr:MBL fold metallo-hydrolase [Candidatus Stahlbacteria bacterium]
MKIRFLGGARSVTGSLFSINNQILVECGLFQGHREEAEEFNRNPPLDLDSVSAVFITHAHLDHSGNLPNIVKKGYRGPIFATEPTIDITSLLLLDAAHIFEQDIRYLNKKLRKRGLPEKDPLYTIEDAEKTIKLFRPLPYHHPIMIEDYEITLFDSGHILGSSQIRIKTPNSVLLFSGDIGRKDMPFLKDPELGIGADVLVMESTYGGRSHEPVDMVKEKLKKLILRISRQKARLLIPAFAVERTQDLIYILHEIRDEVPPVPIYVDSPLANDVTRVFRSHLGIFDQETKELIKADEDPLSFSHLHFVEDVEESKHLNEFTGPVIIISASGMCEGGRILHHLKRTVTDPRNIILFVGFQARNTLGRRIVDGAKRIKIFGDDFNLRCQVEVIDGLSSHAGHSDLIQYASSIPELKKIFLVHGEDEAQGALKGSLQKVFSGEIEVPDIGEEYQI